KPFGAWSYISGRMTSYRWSHRCLNGDQAVAPCPSEEPPPKEPPSPPPQPASPPLQPPPSCPPSACLQSDPCPPDPGPPRSQLTRANRPPSGTSTAAHHPNSPCTAAQPRLVAGSSRTISPDSARASSSRPSTAASSPPAGSPCSRSGTTRPTRI